jgi:hypothetical protein
VVDRARQSLKESYAAAKSISWEFLECLRQVVGEWIRGVLAVNIHNLVILACPRHRKASKIA